MHVPFYEVAERYRAVFFDSYGVLKDSKRIFPEAIETVIRLQDEGVMTCLLTNDSSKSPAALAKPFNDAAGREIFPESAIFSSGLMALDYFQAKLKQGKVAYLGKESSRYYIEAAGLEAVAVCDVSDPHELAALAFLDDEGFDWYGDVNRCLNILREVNIPVLCANGDLSYPSGDKQVFVAVGSLTQMVEKVLSRRFIHYGKPDSLLFSTACDWVRASLPDICKSEVLMVGDTLHTDILGANRFSISSLLVLTGNTTIENFQSQIEAHGIIPDYICLRVG